MEELNDIWVEKYRPKSLDYFVGNKTLVDKINDDLKKGTISNMTLYGSQGTGKTTIARIIVEKLNCDYIYINASDERGIDIVREKIKPFAASKSFNGLKIVILDEADGLTPESQKSLRFVTENYYQTTRFILTCNYIDDIIPALKSRCKPKEVVPLNEKKVAELLIDILEKEKIEYSLSDVSEIVKEFFPDIRLCINSLQDQIIEGKLCIERGIKLKALYSEFLELFNSKITNEKSVYELSAKIRSLLITNRFKSYHRLYKYLFDNIESFKEDKRTNAILTISKYNYESSFIADKEIPFIAMIIELLRLKI